MNIRNRSGPRTLPRGTPYSIIFIIACQSLNERNKPLNEKTGGSKVKTLPLLEVVLLGTELVAAGTPLKGQYN